MAGRSNVKLARQVWSRMFDFLMRTAPERNRSLGRRGLTPNDARALWSLDRVTGRSMRELAEQWECDASNATWIVDRLERFGLAERRPVPGDRRHGTDLQNSGCRRWRKLPWRWAAAT